MPVRAVLADIEGTTTAISFVHDVLFPLARRAMADFVSAHSGDPAHAHDFASVRAAAGVTDEEIAPTLERWMDEDRKDTALKSIQGAIWRTAYERGELHSHVYPDVAGAFKRWQDAGLALFIYSSGSVEAQKLLFRHSISGDLTVHLSGYFDTGTGNKRDLTSYEKIARAINMSPGDILFLSDVTAELDAAAQAGLRTTQLLRPGTPREPHSPHPVATTFDAIDPQAAID